jgi:hypothetical protein
MRNAYRILFGKSERKRLLGRTRRRQEDNIRSDLREIGWKIVYWIHVAQDRNIWWLLVNTVMKCRFP